jgi:hypothetical protein
VLALTLLAPVSSACSSSSPHAVPPPPYAEILPEETSAVDLLLVIDNSNSMAEEQALLAEHAGVLLEELLSPTSLPNGTLPAPVESLHVGVVSSDMGTGGARIQTCVDPIDGDAGELQATGRLEGCADEYRSPECGSGCPWLAHTAEHPDHGRDPANPPIWESVVRINGASERSPDKRRLGCPI